MRGRRGVFRASRSSCVGTHTHTDTHTHTHRENHGVSHGNIRKSMCGVNKKNRGCSPSRVKTCTLGAACVRIKRRGRGAAAAASALSKKIMPCHTTCPLASAAVGRGCSGRGRARGRADVALEGARADAPRSVTRAALAARASLGAALWQRIQTARARPERLVLCPGRSFHGHLRVTVFASKKTFGAALPSPIGGRAQSRPETTKEIDTPRAAFAPPSKHIRASCQPRGYPEATPRLPLGLPSRRAGAATPSGLFVRQISAPPRARLDALHSIRLALLRLDGRFLP